MDANQARAGNDREEPLPPADASWGGMLRNVSILLGLWGNQFLRKAGDLAQTNYELAQELAEKGAYSDAILRLRFVVLKESGHFRAWYLLGRCYLKKGDRGKAAEAFAKAISLKKDFEEARFMLAVAAPDALPKPQWPPSFPVQLVIEHFAPLAENYDEQMEEEGYQGPALIMKALEELPEPAKEKLDILDLGCGTGLAAPLFKPHADRFVGVDVTPEMLEFARLKTDDDLNDYYTELVEKDLRTYLLAQPVPSFDLVLAIDTLPYIGGLAPVFDGLVKALRPGGYAVLTADPLPTNEKHYHLMPQRLRFAHSEEYLRTQAARVQLEVVMMQRAEIATNHPCLLAILHRA